MSIEYKIKTAPSEQPVTLAEVKSFLRIPVANTDQDTVLTGLIATTLKEVERQSYRKLVTQTWTITCNTWSEVIEVIKYGQLASVTSITYLDEDEDIQTVSSDEYKVIGLKDADVGRIVFYADGDFDYPTVFEVEPIVITFVCGFGLAVAVPETFKTAIKMLISDVWAGTCYGEYVQGQMYQERVWNFFS